MSRRLYFQLGLGVFTAIFSWFSKNNLEFPPELWYDLSVAAKLRPPAHVFPLLWHNILSNFIERFSLARCVSALEICGAISLGILAILTFRFFSGFITTYKKNSDSKWHRIMALLISCAGTVCFVFSEPVWLLGRAFCPEMFLLLLTAVSLLLLQHSLSTNFNYHSLLSLSVTSGILAAETPVGFLLPILFITLLRLKNLGVNAFDNRPLYANPIVIAVAMRRMVLGVALSWAFTIAINIKFYLTNDGGAETQTNLFFLIIRYLGNYFWTISDALWPFGFVFAIFVVAPLVIILVRKGKLCNRNELIPIRYALFLTVVGLLSFLQSSGFKCAHFWRWIEKANQSQYFLCLALGATSLIVLLILHIFAVDAYYRNHIEILTAEYPEAILEENRLLQRIIAMYKKLIKPVRVALAFVPFIAITLILIFKFDGTIREMSSVINAIARQTVAECGDCNLIFTDGSYDIGVELAAKMDGKSLKALSMMSKNSPYDIKLRLRGETNDVSRTLLAIGTAETLRTWVKEHNPVVSNIALQVGMELWRNTSMPKVGGLTLRTAGYPAGEAENAAKEARALAERVLNICNKDPFSSGYSKLNSLFIFGQWRLSRMCRMRSIEADKHNQTELSETENELADKLDRANPEWMKIQEKMDWIGKQEGLRLTPQEGLTLSLERADFRLARVYAWRILKDDPDNVKANFAMGMGFFIDKQYARAEKHLRKCLKRAPKEPAVLNNLAITLLRLGHYSEAETNALKALEIVPDSTEIKTTLRHIRKAASNKK